MSTAGGPPAARAPWAGPTATRSTRPRRRSESGAGAQRRSIRLDHLGDHRLEGPPRRPAQDVTSAGRIADGRRVLGWSDELRVDAHVVVGVESDAPERGRDELADGPADPRCDDVVAGLVRA